MYYTMYVSIVPNKPANFPVPSNHPSFRPPAIVRQLLLELLPTTPDDYDNKYNYGCDCDCDCDYHNAVALDTCNKSPNYYEWDRRVADCRASRVVCVVCVLPHIVGIAH